MRRRATGRVVTLAEAAVLSALSTCTASFLSSMGSLTLIPKALHCCISSILAFGVVWRRQGTRLSTFTAFMVGGEGRYPLLCFGAWQIGLITEPGADTTSIPLNDEEWIQWTRTSMAWMIFTWVYFLDLNLLFFILFLIVIAYNNKDRMMQD